MGLRANSVYNPTSAEQSATVRIFEMNKEMTIVVEELDLIRKAQREVMKKIESIINI